ncbi:hypothetical protein GGR95_002968 [Sulfitobacter undariae]|uniref:DUF6950 domain-containing protein n=1 Tax=Sulfitobacter undariae TaxID=1563671 RepID=A0A7W6H206_9RHOB|nr:hypothetical protein [Sulfitobacter undariae]MBB3995313.1 hypothetical protein [Sulfitobacter undariae]
MGMIGDVARHSPLIIEAHRWLSLPMIWGQHDCMLCLADWFERVHGFDPAADIRFTYDSPGSCQKETGFLRDPLTATRRIAEDRGSLLRTSLPPVKGDIGLIRTPDGERTVVCGGLWLGKGWLIKGTPRGATVRSGAAILETVAVWSMRYEDA